MSIKAKYIVQPILKDEYAGWILKKHYAHRMPSVMFAYGIYKNKNLEGVCLFGMPPCQLNYGSGLFKKYRVNTYELTRLVTNENHERNMTSFFVSKCLKALPSPSCIISFADPNNHHHGYIYQATNWIYTGVSQKGGKDKQWILEDREYHAKTITIKWMKEIGMEYDDTLNMKLNWQNNGGIVVENTLQKFRYLYFNGNKKQRKLMVNELLLPILPYPKGDNQRYDASYEPEIQQLLF